MAKSNRTLAIIDLGSNSFYMRIVRVDENGVVKELKLYKQQVQLRSVIGENGELTPEIEQRAFACFQQFAKYLAQHRVDAVRVTGTYTLRKAKRKCHFLAEGEHILGHPIRVVSGTEEARLIYVGATHLSPLTETHLVIDIGGGSTELIVGRHNQILASTSLGMGCVSFQDRFFPAGRLHSDGFQQAIQCAKQKLVRVQDRFLRHQPQDFLGSSGTVLSISGVLEKHFAAPLQVIDRTGMLALLETLQGFKTFADIRLKGLREDRVAILPGGFCVLYAIFEVFDIDHLALSAGGIREGCLYELMQAEESFDDRR